MSGRSTIKAKHAESKYFFHVFVEKICWKPVFKTLLGNLRLSMKGKKHFGFI